MAADGGRAALDHALMIEGGGIDLVVHLLALRHAFAGKHALVQRGRAFEHDPIHRHVFAGAHDEDIVGAQLPGGDIQYLTVTFHVRDFRLQLDQFFNGAGRLGFCAHFQQFAHQHQRDQHRAGFEIHRLVDVEYDDGDAQEIRGTGSQRHQQIHVAAAMLYAGPCAAVEARADPELYRCRQYPLQPARDRDMYIERHEQHFQHHGRDEPQRDEETQFLLLVGLEAIRLFGRKIARHMRIEAGVAYRFDKFFYIGTRRVEGYAGLFSGQINHGSDVR